MITTNNTATYTSLFDLLTLYESSSVDSDWVAATIVTKQRSSYRHAGAIMLVNELGEARGLISGGCLEADIQLHARKVQSYGEPTLVVYDSSDVDNIAAELGLGCNGRVEILVQELKTNHRTLLMTLLARLREGLDSKLLQCYDSNNVADLNAMVLLDSDNQIIATATDTPLPDLALLPPIKHQTINANDQQWSLHLHPAPIKLWVFGGGVDARPVVSIAALMGWKVTLVDHRVTHARDYHFPSAEKIVREQPEYFSAKLNADAAIIMSHNIDLDARWLKKIAETPSIKYIGLLGPRERKQEVLTLAGLNEAAQQNISEKLHGPMGFDIGGDLPESVALSVIAQCHQVLFKGRIKV